MRRIRFALLTLVFVLALPAAAGAQLPYVPGPLVDPAMVTPPESVPPGPVGEYPEDWAKCVSQTQPTWPTAPAGIDPRAVDPAAPNPLLGQRFFVDRMEPAYMQWVKWKRSGETTKANMIWKLAREPRIFFCIRGAVNLPNQRNRGSRASFQIMLALVVSPERFHLTHCM